MRPSILLLGSVLAVFLLPMVVTSNLNEATMDAHGNVKIAEIPPPIESVTTVESPIPYGVDVSWPMHYKDWTFNNNNPLSHQHAYEEYLRGCFGPQNKYKKACMQWESDRMSMNLRQPAISQNYTYAGYAKVATPPMVRQLIQKAWNQREEEDEVQEEWERPNTYLNHWKAPTHMVDITKLLRPSERDQLIYAVQSVLEAWSQQSLVFTSLYGVRIYYEGAILAPHVDRLPLVTSVIIPVEQDIEEDWPLEVVGRDGKAQNLTCHVGDMILYESHSTIHGRPFPLKGKYYASLFIHFEPIGHSKRHEKRVPVETAEESYERALKHYQNQKDIVYDGNDNDIDGEDSIMGNEDTPSPTVPHYVPPDKAGRWKQQFEYEKEAKVGSLFPFHVVLLLLLLLSCFSTWFLLYGCPVGVRISSCCYRIVSKNTEISCSSCCITTKLRYTPPSVQVTPKPTRELLAMTNPHHAAADGLLHVLKQIAAKDRAQLFAKDHNGWTPLHEAARGGRVAVIKYLIDEGAQINERTNFGTGATPLWWAERNRRVEAIALLKKHGAVSLASTNTKK